MSDSVTSGHWKPSGAVRHGLGIFDDTSDFVIADQSSYFLPSADEHSSHGAAAGIELSRELASVASPGNGTPTTPDIGNDDGDTMPYAVTISDPDTTVTPGGGAAAGGVTFASYEAGDQPEDGNSGAAIKTIARSGNVSIDGLISGTAWSSTALTYSFPTTGADYGTQATYGDPAPFNGFAVLNAAQQSEVLRAFSLLSSYTKLTFTKITETTTTHATIRLADSSSPPTAYAYNPNSGQTGGDVFYGQTGENPAMGNFDSAQAILHEIGHAVGLKHGQDNTEYGTEPAAQLDIEYSVMNYPNYIGSKEGYATAAFSPETYMQDDIAVLQYLYGENLGNFGQSLTYTWSSTTGEEFINGVSQGKPFTNDIFETV